MVISDPEWLHGHLQCGQDPGAGRASDGAPEWDFPHYNRRRPDEAHHKTWHDGQSFLQLWASTDSCEKKYNNDVKYLLWPHSIVI